MVHTRGKYHEGSLVEKVLNNLKAFREEKRVSQEWIAQRIGITRAKYARMEWGENKRVDYDILLKIAELFEIDVCQFIDPDGEYVANSPEVLAKLKERETFLLRMNEQLSSQIADKEELIGLLRGGKEG